MKKVLILILKIPLFFLRWLNATIMRAPASYALSLLLFLLLNSFILDKEYGLDGNMIAVHSCVTLILSIVWGLVYTLFKLPVTKKIYSSKFKKILAVLSRLIYALFLFDVSLGTKSEFIHSVCAFVSFELVINAIIVAIKGKTSMQIVLKAQKAMNESYLNDCSATPSSSDSSAEISKAEPAAPVVVEKTQKQIELDEHFNFVVDNFVRGSGLLKFVDGHQQILKNKEGKEFIVPNFMVNEQAVFIVDRVDLVGIQVKQEKDGTYLASHKGKVYTFNKIMNARNAVIQFIKNEFEEDFDIIYILCLSDDRAIIKVNKNSELPILRLSEFGPYIENYRSLRPMGEELKNRIANLVVVPKNTDDYDDDYDDYEFDDYDDEVEDKYDRIVFGTDDTTEEMEAKE